MTERDVFIAALQQGDPAQRRAYLDAACAGRPELRRQVEHLLRLHEGAGSFLESPAPGPVATVEEPPSSERPGTVIGPYKLLEPIGEGGMGAVWMAQQTDPVKRLVAVKLIKAGMDSQQVIARFEAERQALALMDHPHIARVLDAGTTGAGRPYFVMDVVKGVPITQYCDERRLTPRQRLELFIPVCQAVQHAHQKGIIHRDLKPSNVLVALYDGKPVPKVIDFGVAKATGQPLTEKTLVTGFGYIVGTLEYMSPEQAEVNQLDIDTRSDIYSLGVLLYELLAGSPPFSRKELEQAGMLEMLRVIREREPSKPSTKLSTAEGLPTLAANRGTEPAQLTKLLRGELDWIVMKALDKDRNRRYETANGFARDIQRYLADEPVEACPPSAGYRLRKFARKNRTPLRVAGAFLVLLLAGAITSAWLAVRALAAERQALAARDREAERLKQAEAAEKRARAVLKFFQDKVLAAARPEGQEGGVRRDATVREALDRAEPEIARAFADEPLVEASIRNVLGVSYWYLGALDLAQRQQERALALRRQELGPDHPDTVGVLNDLGTIFHWQGNYAEAQKLMAETVEVKRRILGPRAPGTLRSVSNLAGILAEQGLFEEALPLAEETWEIQKRVEGPTSMVTLRSAYNVAIMRHHVGRLAEARSLFEETIQTLESAFSPDHQDTLRAMASLGELLLDQGQAREAEKRFDKILQAQRRVLGETNNETIMTRADLADAVRALGRLEEACRLAEEAAELHRRHLGPDHPQALAARTILADVYRDQGRYAEAGQAYEQALTGLRRKLGPKAPEVQRAMNSYAWLLATAADRKFRDPPRAVQLAEEVVQHAPRFGDKWTTLGAAHYRTGAWQKAIAALEKSEALAPGRFTAVNGLFLAMAQGQLGDKGQARKWYDRDVAWMDKNQPKNEELRRFRAEATELLELKEKK
jgi:serine/threonine protein kinase/Tfp pilus assembly protein PilF